MSDNVTPLHPEKSGRSTRKRIITITAAVCVLILLAAVVLVAIRNDLTDFGAVRRYFHYRNASSGENFGTYFFDAHNANRFAVYDEGLAVASVSGLRLLSDGGENVYEYHANLSAPTVQSRGAFVLMHDVGGSTLTLTHATRGELLSLPDLQPVLDADLADNGAFCCITSEEKYKAVIPVYNEKQERVYAWYSASSYFNQCALSPDASVLAAVCIGQSEATFHSELMLFATDEEEPKAELPLGERLIYELGFVNRSTLCAWAEDELIFASTSGEENARYAPEEMIEQVDFGGDGFVTVLLNSSLAGEQPCVATIGADGSVRASAVSELEILDISAAGNYVAVLTTGGLKIYDSRMRLYAETAETGGAARVQLRADGSAIMETSGSAALYLP